MSWFRMGRTEEKIQAAVEKAFVVALETAGEGVLEAISLNAEVGKLVRQVTNLEIQRDKKQEDFDRKEREIEHSLGLHKAQVEWEVEEASARAKLDVEQENLELERAAFTKQMEFMQGRFEEEVKYQRELLEKMMKRLPTAEILAKIK